MDEPLANPPAELKALLPFVQRANELRTADKVIAYWCCYYAAQLGISGNAKESESKMYLLTLMDTLEDLKSKLADNDAVTNDAASSAYVENFALKVFVGADNEDRSGKATRATAKKFLAASQFIELLKVFGTIEPEMNEKIKYAKWKAADIAKAFKEGMKPQPGPAGGDPKLDAANVETAMGPSTNVTEEEEAYLAREMAKLTTPPNDAPRVGAAPDVLKHVERDDGTAAGSQEAAQSASTNQPSPKSHRDLAPASGLDMSRGNSLGSHKALQASSPHNESNVFGGASPDADEMWKSSSKPTDVVSRSSSTRQSFERPQIQPSSSFASGLGSSPGSRPLPVPPQKDGLPIPPVSAHHQWQGSSPGLDQGAGPGAAPASFWGANDVAQTSDGEAPVDSVLPSVPSEHPPSLGGIEGHPAIERIDPPRSPSVSSLPGTPGQLPGFPGAHGRSSVPSAPAAPTFVAPSNFATAPTAASVHTTPSAPTLPPAVYPDSLDAKLSTRVQKLAKGAASAVDFEDLDTARIQLRQALDILEGRTTI